MVEKGNYRERAIRKFKSKETGSKKERKKREGRKMKIEIIETEGTVYK